MTMLDRMRRHRSWLKWSLALVVLTFIAFYARDFSNDASTTGAAPAGLRDVVANVEGHEITAGEFQQRYQGQVQAYRGAYGGISDQLIKQLGLDQQILQQLVDEQAAMAEAERQGIRVSDEELAQQIFSIPGLQENGQFIGEARYEQLLRAQRPPMSKAQFEDGLRRSMMLDRLRSALTNWMAVTDQELDREFKLRNEKIKVQVVALTADKFRDQVQVSDAEISSWYDAHKAEYRKGEQRKVKYLLVDRDALRAKQTVSAADVQNYYNQNIQQYQTPEQIRASHILLKTEGKEDAVVKKQAEDLLKQIKAGGDFAALAKKFSEDDGSKVNGGDLDYFGRGRMVAEFETAAFALKPGEVSDLVKTQFGYHIIKVVDHKTAATKSLDEVRATIQDTLAWQRVDAQIATKTRELDEKLKAAADVDTAAKELGTTVQESGFFAREDPVPGLGAAPQVAVEAFKLADNAVSDAVNSPRGPVYIMVTGKKDPYVPALDEVKPRVREDVVRNKARDLSRQRGTAIAASLRGAKDFAAAAKVQGLEAKSSELLAREAALPDVGVSPEVDKIAFSLPVGGVSEPIATSDSTVIVKVLERKDVTAQEFSEQKDTFREQVLNERRNKFFTAYMEKAKQNMKIEIRTDVARRAIGA